MSFNLNSISKIISMANAVSNPKQAINILLSKMAQNNPQIANTIKQAINSGKNPKQFIMEQARSGNITLDNLNQLKQYYGLAQKLGLAKKVPSKVWQEAESAIRNGESGKVEQTNTPVQTSRTGQFNGF